jgi:phosphoribosylpyrophosphate synthetase
VTDTIAPQRAPGAALGAKLVRVSMAPLLAEGIRRLHEDGSLVELSQR